MEIENFTYDASNAYERIYAHAINRGNLDDMSISFMNILENYKLPHRKTMYYLFIECVQNVIKHGLNDIQKESVFYFLKKKGEEKYLLITGNPIEKNKKKTITNNIELINNLSKKDIDLLYYHLLNDDYFTESGGAGLGLLQMRRKANYRAIRYHTQDHQDFCYLYIILEYLIS